MPLAPGIVTIAVVIDHRVMSRTFLIILILISNCSKFDSLLSFSFGKRQLHKYFYICCNIEILLQASRSITLQQVQSAAVIVN
jgi:hypothetical protein